MVSSSDADKRVDAPTKDYPTVPIRETGVGWPEESGPPERPSGGRWLRRLFGLALTIGVIFALVIGLKSVDLWPNFRNPFATQTTDRSGPVLLKSIQDLSRYVAAQGSFEVIIDVKEDRRFVPDFLVNERTLFVGAGTVDAYVEFSTVTQGAITVSPDGKSVTVKLPAPVLDKPNLDHNRSYVFAEERGVLNRFSDLFSDDPNRQQELYQMAEQRIAQSARDSELQARAQRNTEAMLSSMLHSLGFETVKVEFTAT
jgi:hypothetical protein